jgi:homoserine dehydrogenase
MHPVGIGLIGLGNVGGGTLKILRENEVGIQARLGFPLRIVQVCSRSVKDKPGLEGLSVTPDWRDVVVHPEVEVVAELVGGTNVAREIVESAIAHGKSVVTANKELMALAGLDLYEKATTAGVNLAFEASVAGGIPIHAVLREGIAGDRLSALFGILNGTSNYILTEIEKHGSAFDDVLKEAQRLGYAEADPSNDVDGFDARSKLSLLAAILSGRRFHPNSIYTEGIRRVSPIDFAYAHQLRHTIRLLASARSTPQGWLLSVRPELVPNEAILASVRGSYNAIWVRGDYGQDTFYYGRGAGPEPTGVAVVSDLMRVAREIRCGSPNRVSPFGFCDLREAQPLPTGEFRSAWYLRFRVADRPGIIATLAQALAEERISIDAVLQLPADNWRDLPFVITVEPTTEAAVQRAVAAMQSLDFLLEAPLALPMEKF